MNCRSCRRSIFWAITVNGKRMPVDRDQIPGGNLRITDNPSPDDNAPFAIVKAVHDPAELGYTSHFATCPQAAKFRVRTCAR